MLLKQVTTTERNGNRNVVLCAPLLHTINTSDITHPEDNKMKHTLNWLTVSITTYFYLEITA
jgi:hypothetical protein